MAVKLARKGWQMRYVPEVVLHHYPSVANATSLRHIGLRNTIVNAWLHRPIARALRWTVFSLGDAPKNRSFLGGLILLVRAVPWIVSERNPITNALTTICACWISDGSPPAVPSSPGAKT